MNKVVSALVVAFAGAAAASLLTTWRKSQLEAKALEKKEIHRWEDDGGSIPEHSSRLMNRAPGDAAAGALRVE